MVCNLRPTYGGSIAIKVRQLLEPWEISSRWYETSPSDIKNESFPYPLFKNEVYMNIHTACFGCSVGTFSVFYGPYTDRLPLSRSV